MAPSSRTTPQLGRGTVVVLALVSSAAALIAVCGIGLLGSGRPLGDTDATAGSLGELGFDCAPTPEEYLRGTPFSTGLSCSTAGADVFVSSVDAVADPETIRRTVARLDGVCSDADTDDGDFLYGPHEAVWVEVTSGRSGSGEIDAASASIVQQVSQQLGVSLRHC